LGAVWDTATKDIPSLREKLREILKTEEKKWVRFGFPLAHVHFRAIVTPNRWICSPLMLVQICSATAL